jgi:hypothetical protein
VCFVVVVDFGIHKILVLVDILLSTTHNTLFVPLPVNSSALNELIFKKKIPEFVSRRNYFDTYERSADCFMISFKILIN